jgi:hypothetical protein
MEEEEKKEEIELSGKAFVPALSCDKVIDFILKSEKFPEHKHLVFAKINSFFKEKMSGEGWNNLGKVFRVNDFWWSITNIDIVIIVNEEVWKNLATREKITLMLHFLSKIKVYYKYNNKRKKTLKPPSENESADYDITFSGRINYKIVPPDIEEFENVSSKFKESYEELKKVSKIVKE